MDKIIEEKLKEIIDISEKCPPLYKVECFKILFGYLLSEKVNKQSTTVNNISQNEEYSEDKTQREILEADLHHKFKYFMKKYEIKLDKINQLFYIENNAFLGLYDDLKVYTTSEVQIRIALLQAMINAMISGDFEFDGEAVRAECLKRKAYDLNNFAGCFKRNINLFDSFVSYKKGETIKLSETGKKELAKVIEEISN